MPNLDKVDKKDLEPHSSIGEQFILSDLLLNQTNKELIFSRLSKEVFYVEAHKKIYEACFLLYSKNKEINLTTVSDQLADLDYLSDIGGTTFLFQLLNQIRESGSIETYLILLLDKYLRRSLIKVSWQISKLGYDNNSSVDSLFDQAEQMLLALTQTKPKFGLLSTSEILLETFVDLEQKAKTGHLAGISSGFFDLDIVTQGFQKSDLIIIAGRPSMGKTAFALNLARNIAEYQNFPVAIFSLEMSRQQLIYRFLATESQIVNSRLRAGNINSTEWSIINKAIAYLASLNIYLDDTPNTSILDIRAKLNKLKSNHGYLGVIIVDYLQLITDDFYKNNRVQELSRITRNLKILAREFHIPILVLSQLSRSVESRQNKRPLLSDLRESGCLSEKNEIYLIREDISVSLLYLQTLFSSSTLFGKSSARLTPFPTFIKKIFSTGQKPIYLLQSFGIYSIEITSTHKFLSLKGWAPLCIVDTFFSVAILDRFNYYKIRCYSTLKKVGLNITFLLTRTIAFFAIDFVYDIWVPSLGNFVSNNLFVHNSIEQDADVVLMLYREQYYLPNLKENNITEVIIAKQRNGPIGTINLIFDPKLVSFENFVLLE